MNRKIGFAKSFFTSGFVGFVCNNWSAAMAMASSQFFCDHQLHPSCNSIRRTTLPSFRPHGSSSFRPKPQFQRTPFLRVRASADRKQVEVCGFSLVLCLVAEKLEKNGRKWQLQTWDFFFLPFFFSWDFWPTKQNFFFVLNETFEKFPD